MELTKDWYRSKTIWGALIALVSTLARLAGVDLGLADQAELVDAALSLSAGLGAVLSLYGRISATRAIGRKGG